MRLIKSNNIESEYPKRHVCDECGAELEYDKEDVHIGWMGCEYVTCPVCGSEIMVGKSRVQLPTWKATFHHTSIETGAVNIEDDEIQTYVNRAVKLLCSDERNPGEFYVIWTGNFLVVGIKRMDGVDLYVTKDYWEDSIIAKDYGMVK